MFQFSDDIDDEALEDVLSISTNLIANEGTTNNLTSCTTREVETTSGRSTSNIALDDFDEDDLILSAAFEDANNSFCENQKLAGNSPVLKKSTTPSTDIPSPRITLSSRNSDYTPSPIVVKHKSPNSFKSPSAVKYSKIQYERRFAGPAGLIPKKSEENSVMPTEALAPSKSQQTETCETEDFFCDNNPSWRALLNDANSNVNTLLQRMNDFTISNVHQLNLMKDTSWKIPVFGAIIYNIDSSVKDPDVTLRDPSGQIMGTFDKDLWDQYNHLLSVGSALLLRQVSVLSLISSRKVYLNITMNNIVTIYTVPSGNNPLTITQVRTLSETDFLNETKTDRYSKQINSPVSSISSSKNSCFVSKARSNTDLLNLIKNSNNSESQDASNVPKTPSIKNQAPSSKSTLVAISNSMVDAGKTSMKSCESKASIIFNELEGLDADSLFDDF